MRRPVCNTRGGDTGPAGHQPVTKRQLQSVGDEDESCQLMTSPVSRRRCRPPRRCPTASGRPPPAARVIVCCCSCHRRPQSHRADNAAVPQTPAQPGGRLTPLPAPPPPHTPGQLPLRLSVHVMGGAGRGVSRQVSSQRCGHLPTRHHVGSVGARVGPVKTCAVELEALVAVGPMEPVKLRASRCEQMCQPASSELIPMLGNTIAGPNMMRHTPQQINGHLFTETLRFCRHAAT